MLENLRKGSSEPSIKSPVVDEERRRPGHWLGLVHVVFPPVAGHHNGDKEETGAAFVKSHRA